MTAWLLLNSLGLAVLAVLLYIVLRQLGYVLQRVGQVGARATSEGPRVGENVTSYLPAFSRGLDSRKKPSLVVFGSDSCSICAGLKEGVHQLARSWSSGANILLIYDCRDNAESVPMEELSKGLFFGRVCGLRKKLGATFVPYALVTNSDGIVIGKGLVNEIGHLESLLELENTTTRTATPPGVSVA